MKEILTSITSFLATFVLVSVFGLLLLIILKYGDRDSVLTQITTFLTTMAIAVTSYYYGNMKGRAAASTTTGDVTVNNTPDAPTT